MTWGDAVATAALVLALWSLWRGRHRVRVGASISEAGWGDDDGEHWRDFLCLKVSTTGGPVSVESIAVDVVARSRDSAGAIVSTAGPDWFGPLGAVNMARLEALPERLEDGASVTWLLSVTPAESAREADGRVPLVVRVGLSNGRTITTDTVRLRPSRERGPRVGPDYTGRGGGH